MSSKIIFWQQLIDIEQAKPYFKDLRKFVAAERAKGAVYPEAQYEFRALKLTPLDNLKVVIVGQDPYHGPGQAMGLSFSVPDGVPLPPSLKNIYKELEADIGKAAPKSGDLTHWAKQGVLLLNAVLTVRSSQAASHQKRGWETFTDKVLKAVSDKEEHVVFILWGGFARSKKSLIDLSKHTVIESAHPSPLSAYAGFFGSKPFSRTNEALMAHDQTTIDWA